MSYVKKIMTASAIGVLAMAPLSVNATDSDMPSVYMVTIHTDNYSEMKAFFSKKMGMEISSEQGEFAEFKSVGARFALASFTALGSFLNAEGFKTKRSGSGVGVGFRFATPESVDAAVKRMKDEGISFVADPKAMPWGEYTAFFSDPDGNVHELVAEIK